MIVSPATYPVPAALIATFVIAPFPSTVVLTVRASSPDPEFVVATPFVAVNPPTPPDNVPKLRVSTPPRLELGIVIVSPIT